MPIRTYFSTLFNIILNLIIHESSLLSSSPHSLIIIQLYNINRHNVTLISNDLENFPSLVLWLKDFLALFFLFFLILKLDITFIVLLLEGGSSRLPHQFSSEFTPSTLGVLRNCLHSRMIAGRTCSTFQTSCSACSNSSSICPNRRCEWASCAPFR